jgi:hypothetical protein
MRCYKHPNRETTGQCKECGAFLCGECRAPDGRCYECIRKELLNKKTSAIVDIALFITLCAIGCLITANLVIPLFAEIPVADLGTAVGYSVIFVAPFTYMFGSAALGVKKLFGWMWKKSVVATILFCFPLFIAGAAGGSVVAPYILYKAFRTLYDKKWKKIPIITPTYRHAPPPTWTPPPYQTTQTNAVANFCIHCGASVRPEDNFCKNCGKQK